MTCAPVNLSELNGSYVSCTQLVVRECLTVAGVEITGGPGTTRTDGVTLQGDGSLATPVALKAVQHDGSLAGAGTVASPLSVVGVSTDHIDLTDGALVPVAPPGVMRIRSLAGVPQVSYDGGAFRNIVTL